MEKLKINEIINRDIKIFRDYEFIVAEKDDWGQWRQNTVKWLLKPLDVNIKVMKFGKIK